MDFFALLLDNRKTLGSVYYTANRVVKEKLMERMNKSAKVLALFYCLLFCFIFICNVLTLKVADDFNYCFSWADKSRITSVSDIIPSMAAHANTMNGRLLAHFTAQFFLMLPDWLFDIVNTFVFVMQIPLIVRISKGDESQNNLLHIGVFCAMWAYELSFGQVNLWLDGACNYLWNVAVGLLFVQPYVIFFMNEKDNKMRMPKVLFLLLAFIVGGWGESGSAAFIFIAAAVIGLACFWQHRKVPYIYLAGLVLAIAGYVSMYLAPAQATKGGEMSLLSLCGGLFRCLWRLSDIWILVVAFAVLFFLNVRNQTEKNRLVLALIFFFGAMCANFILMFAVSYPERVVLSTTVLLIVADAILLQEIFSRGNYRAVAISLLILLVTTTPIQILWGTYDIYKTYSIQRANIEYLTECAAVGTMDVELPVVHADTKYAAVFDLRYLSTEDPTTWPNNAMANYYGLNSILGVD